MGNRIGERERSTQTDNWVPEKEKYLMSLAMDGITCSGKSTFIKQMRILYGTGFTDEERYNDKKFLIANLLFAFKELVRNSHKMSINIASDEASKELAATDPFHAALTAEMVNHIKSLWEDDGMYHNNALVITAN